MNWWVLRHLSSSSSWSVFKFKHSIEEGDWPPHSQLLLETIKETINYQRRGLSSSWAASDSDYQIHSLVSLELGSLQSYCPLETHLYQEQLRWKSQQPCYPPHHFWHYPYIFFHSIIFWSSARLFSIPIVCCWLAICDRSCTTKKVSDVTTLHTSEKGNKSRTSRV